MPCFPYKSYSFAQSKYSPFSFDTLCRVTAIVLAVVKSGLASTPDSGGDSWNRLYEVPVRQAAFGNSRAVHSSSGLSPDLQELDKKSCMGPKI